MNLVLSQALCSSNKNLAADDKSNQNKFKIQTDDKKPQTTSTKAIKKKSFDETKKVTKTNLSSSRTRKIRS